MADSAAVTTRLDHQPRRTSSPRGLLSTRGVVLAAGGSSAAVAAAVLGEPDLLRLGIFVALLPVLSLSWTVLLLERDLGRLAVSRQAAPAEVASGTPVTIRLTVERRAQARGRGRRPAAVLAEDLLPAGVSRRTAPPRLLLAAGEQHQSIAYTIVPLRRGTLSLGPTRTRPASPLGLADRRVELSATTEITVTPRVVQLPVAATWRQPRTVGEHRPRRHGTAPAEDASVRPYLRGDDVRLVHWRSSARRGELQVREGLDLRTPRSLLLLDTTGRAGNGFEVAVDLAASIGAHLLELDHDVETSLLGQALPTRCRSRADLLARLAEAQAAGRSAARESISAGRGDIVVLCTQVDSALADGAAAELRDALVASLPIVAGSNPALALIATPDHPGGDEEDETSSSHEAAARLTGALTERGWVTHSLPSAAGLPALWPDLTHRATTVAGGRR